MLVESIKNYIVGVSETLACAKNNNCGADKSLLENYVLDLKKSINHTPSSEFISAGEFIKSIITDEMYNEFIEEGFKNAQGDFCNYTEPKPEMVKEYINNDIICMCNAIKYRRIKIIENAIYDICKSFKTAICNEMTPEYILDHKYDIVNFDIMIAVNELEQMTFDMPDTFKEILDVNLSNFADNFVEHMINKFCFFDDTIEREELLGYISETIYDYRIKDHMLEYNIVLYLRKTAKTLDALIEKHTEEEENQLLNSMVKNRIFIYEELQKHIKGLHCNSIFGYFKMIYNDNWETVIDAMNRIINKVRSNQISNFRTIVFEYLKNNKLLFGDFEEINFAISLIKNIEKFLNAITKSNGLYNDEMLNDFKENIQGIVSSSFINLKNVIKYYFKEEEIEHLMSYIAFQSNYLGKFDTEYKKGNTSIALVSQLVFGENEITKNYKTIRKYLDQILEISLHSISYESIENSKIGITKEALKEVEKQDDERFKESITMQTSQAKHTLSGVSEIAKNIVMPVVRKADVESILGHSLDDIHVFNAKIDECENQKDLEISETKVLGKTEKNEYGNIADQKKEHIISLLKEVIQILEEE